MDRLTEFDGTLATAYGCMGGYIAHSKHLVDGVRSITPPFISTTSLAPAIDGGALASVRHLRAAIIESSPSRNRAKLSGESGPAATAGWCWRHPAAAILPDEIR